MRNYLQPRRLAEVATATRVADVRRRDDERARQEARSTAEAQQIAEALTKTVILLEVKAGPQGTLFGSVTPSDIADEIWRARRIRVDRRKIGIDEPIKRVGRYDVPVEVFQDVTVEVKTMVVPEGGELPPEDAPEDGELAAEDAPESGGPPAEDAEEGRVAELGETESAAPSVESDLDPSATK